MTTTMLKRSIIFLLTPLFFHGCYQDKIKFEEDFGKAAFSMEDSSFAFFKSHRIYQPQKNEDSPEDVSSVRTISHSVRLYLYNLRDQNTKIIHDFGKVDDWPEEWYTHMDFRSNFIVYSLKYARSDKDKEPSGIYFYSLREGINRKIHSPAQKFWVSPDNNLIIFHQKQREDNYRLYGYFIPEKEKSLLDEDQPELKDVQWLGQGEAALLIPARKDSAILFDFREPNNSRKVGSQEEE